MTALAAARLADRYTTLIRSVEREAIRHCGPYAQTLIDASIRQALTGHSVAPSADMPPPPGQQALAREVTFAAQDAGVRRLWQQHRIVYCLDADLWTELGDTDPATVVPAGLLRHLPHPDPFIALPQPLVVPLSGDRLSVVGGFFVTGRVDAFTASTHHRDATGHLGLLFLGMMEHPDGRPITNARGDQDATLTRVTLDVSDDRDITVDDLENAVTRRFNVARYRLGDPHETVPMMIRRAVSALIYLCATNADLRPLPAAAARRVTAGSTGKPPRLIEVGYQVGAALRAHRRSGDNHPGDPQAATRSVRPHLRRAHFHTYLTGPNRTQRRVKWLPPIPVKVRGDAGKPTVITVS